ncbi:uncharacterized protein M6G45_017769 [Spheniscus humboldti]
MNLEPGSDKEVSCRVVNNHLNAMCESRVLISDVFFPSTSPWMTAFLVILFLNIAVIAAIGYKLNSSFTQSRKAVRLRKSVVTEKEGLKTELEQQKATHRAGKYSSTIKTILISSYR